MQRDFFFGDYYGDKSTLAQLMHHDITWISMDQNLYFCGYGTELFENEKISATPWHSWAVMNQCAALQWCQNECDGISNHWRLDCLFNCLFRCTSKKASKLCVIGLCEGNSPVTSEFPTQKASNVENVSIWLHHHALDFMVFKTNIAIISISYNYFLIGCFRKVRLWIFMLKESLLDNKVYILRIVMI